MRAAMVAVLDKSRSVNGTPTSLASLGYDYVSMDDGWQGCNCSTRQAIDPGLPTCSIGTVFLFQCDSLRAPLSAAANAEGKVDLSSAKKKHCAHRGRPRHFASIFQTKRLRFSSALKR